MTPKPPSVDRPKGPEDWKPHQVRAALRAVTGPIAGARILPIVLAATAGVGAVAEARDRGSNWPLAIMQGVGTVLGIIGAFSGRKGKGHR